MNQNQYHEAVEELAREANESDERAHHVAQVAIVAPHTLDHHKVALQFGASPYRRDRIWPKDVLESTAQRYPYRVPTTEDPDNLRDLAVLVLEKDIMDARRGDL